MGTFGTFKIRFNTFFFTEPKMYWKLILKSQRFVPKSDIPVVVTRLFYRVFISVKCVNHTKVMAALDTVYPFFSRSPYLRGFRGCPACPRKRTWPQNTRTGLSYKKARLRTTISHLSLWMTCTLSTRCHYVRDWLYVYGTVFHQNLKILRTTYTKQILSL